MGFDLATAKPVEASAAGGFDLSTAKPAGTATSAAEAPKKPEAGFLDYTPVPIAENVLALASGAAATPLAGIIGALHGGDADVVHGVQDKLTYQPRTAGGKAMQNVISYPFEKTAELGNYLGEKAVDYTPFLPDEMRATIGAGVNAGVQFLPALIGKGVGATAKAMPARTMPANIVAAGKAGLKLTPDEAGAGPVSRAAAGVAGEAKLAKKISNENQSVHVEKVSKDLELPKGTELDREALEAVREKHGQSYEVMRKAGTVALGEEFTSALEAAAKDVRIASKELEHRKDSPILKIVDSLSGKETLDANTIVSEVKNLRKDAKKAFRSGDEELGIGSLDVARALEDALDRHVEKLAISGEIDPGAMNALKKARVIIAKSYAADKALRGTEINPQVYAKMLEDRVPLTGGAKEVAEFGRDFPRSAQKPSHMTTSVDAGDVIMALLKSGGGFTKEALFTLGARPTARAILSSDIYQAIMRNPGLIRRALATTEADAAMTGAGIVGAAQEKRKQ